MGRFNVYFRFHITNVTYFSLEIFNIKTISRSVGLIIHINVCHFSFKEWFYVLDFMWSKFSIK